MIVLRIVHVCMMVTIVVFGGLMAIVTHPAGDAMAGSAAPVRGAPPPFLTPIMAALAATTLAAIALVRRRMATARERGPGTTEAAQPRPTSRLYVGAILSWALAESIAVDGLVLGIAHRDMAAFLPFAAVSLAVLLLLWPRRGHIQYDA
jgi:hypothetical protein